MKRKEMTMTQTEEIYENLMAAAGDPVATEKVFHEYGGSKGPFYIALAKATTIQQERFKDISQKCEDTDKSYQEKQQQIKNADQQLTGINQSIDGKTKEITLLDTKIGEKQILLDEVKMIAGLGFGTKQLVQLREMLSKMAASQGVKPAEAAAIFFNQIGNYHDLISLELEVKGAQVAAEKAKADKEFWQAAAKTAEAKSKARKTAIDFTDKFIAQGVRQNDLPHWDRIIKKAGVKPEKLANALEQHGSLEKFYQHRQEEVKTLVIKIIGLTNEVKTLAGERQQISDSIGILRKEALAELVKMSQKTLDNMDNLAIKSGESISSQQQKAAEAIETVRQSTQTAVESISKKVLEEIQSLVSQAAQNAVYERQAGVLSQELIVARALKSQYPEYWKKVPFNSVREMLNGIVLWSRAGGDHNPALLKPSYPLSSKISSYSYYTNSASLNEVLEWAVANICSDNERIAATNGYIVLPIK
jgi:hypothetical protein